MSELEAVSATEEFIMGRNSVLEALKSDRPINKIMVAKGERQGSIREIIGLARDNGLIVQEVEMSKLDALTKGQKHQGVIATTPPVAYAEMEDILLRLQSLVKSPL